MGFPTVFIVPSQVDAEKLREQLWEWNATLVANAAKFEPNHPEMATIEIIATLNNQSNNTPKDSQQCLELEDVKRSAELPRQLVEVSSLGEVKNKLQMVEGVSKECLVLNFVREGWRFRLKTVGGKRYLCARNSLEERSLGIFDEETKLLIEKHNIKVNGLNES